MNPHRWRPRTGGGRYWLADTSTLAAGGVVLLVFGMLGALVLHYNGRQDRAHEAIVVGAKLEALLYEERAIEDMVDRQAPYPVADAVAARVQVSAQVDELRARDGLPREFETLFASVDRYRHSLDRELALLSNLRFAEARELDAVEVEPAYAALSAELGRLQQRSEDDTRAAERMATTIFDSAMTGAAAMIGLFVLWRERQRHALRAALEGRRVAEAERGQLAAIVESSDDAIIARDMDGVVVSWNRGAERMYGWTAAEVVGTRFENHFPGGQGQEIEPVLSAARTGEAVEHIEGRRRRKDGTPVIVSLSVFPVRDGEARVVAAAGIARDITAASRAESARRQAEHHLRVVVTNAPVIMWAVDTLGVFTLMEGKGLSDLGLDPHDAVGKSAYEVFRQMPRFIEHIERGLRGEEFSAAEPIGQRVYEARHTPLRDPSGAVISLLGVAYDVTDRVEVEKKHAWLASIIESTDDAVIGRDTEGRVITWNPGAEKMFGWSAAEILGTQFVGHFLRQMLPLVQQWHEQSASGDRLTNFEAELVRKDGSRLTGSMSTFHIVTADGTRLGMVSMVRDMTMQRALERARRSAETRLREVTSNAPVVVWAFDAEGVYTLAEGAALAVLDTVPGALVGRSVWRTLSDYPDILKSVERALAGEEFEAREQISAAWFDTHYRPLRDEQGAVSGVAAVSVDVTERVRAERALLQAQKVESLALLAGGVAHDFNNLLVGILGNASVARSLVTDPEAEEPLNEIEVAARRAADLAAQMLAYSGRGRFVVEKVDLNAAVQEMAGLLRISAGHATCEWRLAESVPLVEVDPTQVRQVIMNLVTNASDATAEGGTIRISTGEMDASAGYLAEPYNDPALAPGQYVYLEVTDTGSGMDEQTMARVFDPFFTTKFTGRGLGLAAVLGIVRGHRGAMKVTSRPGQGATFRLLLPPASAAAVGATPAQAASPAIADGTGPARLSGKVLVVDDEAVVRSVTARALKRYGLEVIEAADGNEGVAVFREYAAEIACVLLDVTMPGLSGESVFEQIRGIRPDVPVILVSGYSEQEAMMRFEGADLSGFIQKPFELATLRDQLRRALAA